MNIEQFTQEQLEALAYNLLLELKKFQNNLAIVEQRIQFLKNKKQDNTETPIVEKKKK